MRGWSIEATWDALKSSSLRHLALCRRHILALSLRLLSSFRHGIFLRGKIGLRSLGCSLARHTFRLGLEVGHPLILELVLSSTLLLALPLLCRCWHDFSTLILLAQSILLLTDELIIVLNVAIHVLP